ncbi:MAG: sulfatase-like hydrolase/transferase, partial [Planctomycetota bacterium]
MRRSPTLLSISLLLWTLTACAPTDDAPRDVLFITVDTLRADMVGVNGHPRPSTPNLDRIGGAGVVFERHYSTVPMTAPSHA